jgi:hypothetical protein
MNRTLARAIASSLVTIVSFTTAPLACAQQGGDPAPAQTAPAQPAQTSQQDTAPQNHQPPVELPENPGQNNTTQPSTTTPNVTQAAPQQRIEPNGTAVAPPIETSGGAASKPAGVAIAPPKQRQIRSLLIKLGVLAGAGVAIGTVVGLSAASPGHVPNSPGH